MSVRRLLLRSTSLSSTGNVGFVPIFGGARNLFQKVRNGIYRMSFTAWGKTVDGRSIKMTSTDQHVFVLANMPLALAIRNGTPIFSVVLVLLLWLFFKRRTNSLVGRRSQAIPENRLHEV